MKVRVVKAFRHGRRKFVVGEIGTVVARKDYHPPSTIATIAFLRRTYDYYVKFRDYKTIGVNEKEVKVIKKRAKS